MVDPTDCADIVSEAAEGGGEKTADDRFRDRTALLIAVLAAILAIGGLGGGNATDDMIQNNIRASDTWNFFQAKNQRQTAYEIAAEDLRLQLSVANLAPDVRAGLQRRLAEYEATVARYESEPDPERPNDLTAGEGKRELRARAQSFEAVRERAEAQDSNFDFAEVFMQLAVVLASVAILALSRPLRWVAIGLGVLGALLTINGFFLLVPLPI